MTSSLFLLLGAAGGDRLGPGQEAPDFSALASTGETIRLSDYHGKKMVVLAFYPKAFTGG